MEKIYVGYDTIVLEERKCRICNSTYKYDKEDGSDLGCCCQECEEDWIAFENDQINFYTDLEEWEEV